MTQPRDLPPIHPGEQLREEFTRPLGLTAYRLAPEIGVPITRIQAIVAERRGITGETAVRLARYFHSICSATSNRIAPKSRWAIG
jgi:addiction module HigA family antidote